MSQILGRGHLPFLNRAKSSYPEFGPKDATPMSEKDILEKRNSELVKQNKDLETRIEAYREACKKLMTVWYKEQKNPKRHEFEFYNTIGALEE